MKLTNFLFQLLVLSVCEDVRLRTKQRDNTDECACSVNPKNQDDFGRSHGAITRLHSTVTSKVLPPLASSPVRLASIDVSFMQWKTRRVKQPPALIKPFCPAFHSLHGNYAAVPKHPRHGTKQEADCPPPRTPHSCAPSPG